LFQKKKKTAPPQPRSHTTTREIIEGVRVVVDFAHNRESKLFNKRKHWTSLISNVYAKA
jgi:hypothetical protein